MRTAGSYRVLLNTHLWAQMKCDRANQKSIRITAQHEDEVAVFLIMVSSQDKLILEREPKEFGMNPVLLTDQIYIIHERFQ